MWICLNNAFFSIVEPSPRSTTLLVRARQDGDIEKIFPRAKVEKTPGRDYLYRARIERKVVAEAIADSIVHINYGNFKNSVGDHNLHRAYGRVWHVMSSIQPLAPYSGRPIGNCTRSLLDDDQ